MALSREIPESEHYIKNPRRFYLHAALLCWTILSRDGSKYGLTHVMLFPAGKSEKAVEYYDAESTKLFSFRNSFIAFGRTKPA